MARGLLRKPQTSRQVERDSGEASPYSLDIQIDERDGLLRIYDPRAFHGGRRAFCRRLLEAAADHPGFEKAEIDLAAASCRLKFDPRSATARSMADTMTAAVRHAAQNGSRADRPHWWSRPSHWSTLTAIRTPDGVSWWETLDTQPGRIQLRHEALSSDRSRLARVAETLESLDGVESTRISTWFRTLTLDYRPESPIAHRLLDAVEDALRDSTPSGLSHREIAPGPREPDAGAVAVETGYRRLRYLALAGGSFAMTVVGLVVPGVPTVPFLLATSYYLARSSPRLNDRLRRTAIFGPILVEWEQYQGLSRSSKAKLIGLTAAIVVVTVVLSAASPVAMVVILIIALFSAYGIARLPGIPADASVASGLQHQARLALPSP
jgi:uncharacterized membrane protein YbaN (DUF454 family)